MNKAYLRQFLSDSARRTTRSDIRELLKLTARPEVISLAGGLPSPECFPVDEIVELLPRLIRSEGQTAFQYGVTEGDAGLRRELVKLMAQDGIPALDPDRVLVTSASQQALDLCGRVFLSPGDTVLCGLPSYLGALGAFSALGAHLEGIPLDDDGMRMDLLSHRIVELRSAGVRPKLIYVVPDFQNPSGVTLGLTRRRLLLQIAREFDLLVVEDSPYRRLRYDGETLPSLLELDPDGRVISLRTFSKILFPGLRLGWVVAAEEVIGQLVTAKQQVDLCTSGFGQMVAREFLRAGLLPPLIERTRALYAERRLAILDALERHLDPSWGVRWTRPEGGMFLWVTLPGWMSARHLLERSLERHVAFVCGDAFHCDRSGRNTLRLNFSYPTPELLHEAVRRLADAIEGLVAEHGSAGEGHAQREIEGETAASS